ncbi:MAG TPA: hypothetical protein VM925_04645 [Labilithrix sp.]|nr:hypothetical protein [Labilithrix sp.]
MCLAYQSPNCTAAANVWSCETNTQCLAPQVCCILTDPTTDAVTSCDVKVSNGQSRCMAAVDCGATGGRKACTTNSDCFTNVCRLEKITTSLGFTIVIRACK